MRRVLAFLREDDGVDAVEYGLMISLIFLVILAAVTSFATNTTALYTKIASNM
jgi:Flp pilus assembly pilin Flp